MRRRPSALRRLQRARADGDPTVRLAVAFVRLVHRFCLDGTNDCGYCYYVFFVPPLGATRCPFRSPGALFVPQQLPSPMCMHHWHSFDFTRPLVDQSLPCRQTLLFIDVALPEDSFDGSAPPQRQYVVGCASPQAPWLLHPCSLLFSFCFPGTRSLLPRPVRRTRPPALLLLLVLRAAASARRLPRRSAKRSRPRLCCWTRAIGRARKLVLFFVCVYLSVSWTRWLFPPERHAPPRLVSLVSFTVSLPARQSIAQAGLPDRVFHRACAARGASSRTSRTSRNCHTRRPMDGRAAKRAGLAEPAAGSVGVRIRSATISCNSVL